MPINKVKGGYKVQGAKTVHKTKKDALKQLAAIKVSQAMRGKK